MASSAPCTSVLPVGRPRQVMWHITVWRPNVVSVLDGDILMMSATFKSVEDVIPWGMWSITVQSIHLPSWTLTALMKEPIPMTMTSTPLWITTRGIGHIEPGARVYEGSNVTIFFLSHVFFLITVVQCPYSCFAPLHEETDHHLLTFPPYSSSLIIPL